VGSIVKTLLWHIIKKSKGYMKERFEEGQ